MKLGDFFAQLSYGELSGLSIGMEGAGTIDPTQQMRVTNFTQKALTRIYSRFSHNVSYVNIALHEDIHTYRMQTQYTVSDDTVGNNATRYIQDSISDPFLGNLIKITAIRLEGETEDDDATDILINDTIFPGSAKTISFDSFYLSEPEADRFLTVELMMDHTELLVEGAVDLETEIILAPVLYEALEAKVASMIFSGMSGEERMAKARKLESDYERICSLIEKRDLLQNSSSAANSKFSNGGFI
jgi:hypothetical protein